MILWSKLGQGREGSRDFDHGCRIESDGAVEIGVHRTPIKGLDKKSLRLEVEPSQGKLVEVIRLADGSQPFRFPQANVGRGEVAVWYDFLRVTWPEQQEYQTSGG